MISAIQIYIRLVWCMFINPLANIFNSKREIAELTMAFSMFLFGEYSTCKRSHISQSLSLQIENIQVDKMIFFASHKKKVLCYKV